MLGWLFASMGAFAQASESAPLNADEVIDCPLRDAPFSLDMPLMDALQGERAVAVINQSAPELLDRLPDGMKRTQVPTFGAILSLRSAAAIARVNSAQLRTLERELAKLEVTESDQRLRCDRYDGGERLLEVPDTPVRLLVFTKVNGFDHGLAITAATQAVKALSEQQGWGVVVSDDGSVFNPKNLSQFNAVVWNNNSGDVLTLSQRHAFEDYIHQGGGYVGIHGAGGDSLYYWPWYAETLIGAQFIGHPMNPQFQTARLAIEKTPSGIGSRVGEGWTMTEEWYSFARSPRASGAHVVATLDESSYNPGEVFGRDLHMGDDHPIVWTRCVGQGRSFYTGIGHRPEVYHIPETLMLLRDGLLWATGQGERLCSGEE